MTAVIESNNELNITRLSKVEEDNVKLFKKLDDMTKAIDRLNIEFLMIYEARYIKTHGNGNCQKINSN